MKSIGVTLYGSNIDKVFKFVGFSYNLTILGFLNLDKYCEFERYMSNLPVFQMMKL